MMVESSRMENASATSVVANNLDWNKASIKLFAFVKRSRFFYQEGSVNTVTEDGILLSNSSNPDSISSRTTIYVCTICHVFSATNDEIKEHIATDHSACIPTGRKVDDFVSKLQALKNENKKKHSKKVGRPKKIVSESLSSSVDKLPTLEPIPGPDGLYWCQKCLKYFKKSRQLSMHVCLELDDDDLLSESSVESDDSIEYRTYMDVEPTPWFRRPKMSWKEKKQNHLNKEKNDTNVLKEEQINKTTPNWRDDPSYIPLFGNDKERHAFEEHLKSIDYSCVDNLFIKEEKKVLGKKKRSCLHSSISVYSCILCKKVQNSLTHIRMHCLTHTELKPFTCPKCPYRCNTKGSLYTHMRNHTGNVFRCSHCDFKCTKRAHLLDHEETHSGVSHLCQLCKNSYKTLKSLIAHVKKYHTNQGGKKFLKLLTSKNYKESVIQCRICAKIFMSQSAFDVHNQKMHPVTVVPSETETAVKMIENQEDTPPEAMEISGASLMPSSDTNLDPLAEIVLNNLLQQKNTVPIELYEDVFPQLSDSSLIPAVDALNENFVSNPSQTLSPLTHTSEYLQAKDVLAECDKNLNLEIFNECLRDSKFAEEVIGEACMPPKLSNECHQVFDLPQIPLDFPSDSIMSSDITKDSENMPKELSELNADDLADKSCLNESKPAEIKLFEKCRRAPAYVCCVCSGIFICPQTLKAHLKEHINTTNSLIEQAAQDFAQEKLSENDADLDNVCRILQDPSDACSNTEEELEKLYTSSLDKIWYLPEVSVVLENDPALFDSLLDDISNFPIADKFDETEDMDVKCSEIF